MKNHKRFISTEKQNENSFYKVKDRDKKLLNDQEAMCNKVNKFFANIGKTCLKYFSGKRILD